MQVEVAVVLLLTVLVGQVDSVAVALAVIPPVKLAQPGQLTPAVVAELIREQVVLA
jgi:hypothetical protein